MPAWARTPRCLETFCWVAPSVSVSSLTVSRPVAQRVEHADPHRLADHAEALGDQLDERLWKGVGDGGSFVHRNHYTTVELY